MGTVKKEHSVNNEPNKRRRLVDGRNRAQTLFKTEEPLPEPHKLNLNIKGEIN